MKINPKIKEILKEADIFYDDALGYLLAVHYGHRPTYIPDSLRLKVNATKIVEKEEKGGYKWNLPLFEGTEFAFEWVATEYVPLFKEAGSERTGKVRESTARMKKFFAKNPQYRKEDVIEATKMYLLNTDPRYMMFPHYFIEKGKGLDKVWPLIDWIEKLELSNSLGEGRTSVQNTMQ